jgi:hypothetical protein
MTRLSLALILLFIAPSAWGQSHTLTICDGKDKSCGQYGYTLDGRPLTLSNGTITSVVPQCEPGWQLVMAFPVGGHPLEDHEVRCAWVLKEPIYK